MKILITGVCGFVGSSLARGFLDANSALEIFGIDNLSRAGSELNRPLLKKLGVHFLHGDIRSRSDVELLPDADWVIDAAANPSVLAGAEGSTTRQLLEHNVLGTVNVLEYCRRRNAGLILLSTSRIYSVSALSALPLERRENSFSLRMGSELPPGVTCDGIAEDFSTSPPLSLYGVSKFVSERLALEYGEAFRFPVWVNRCGVLSGAGQFGRADQGILSFWIHGLRSSGRSSKKEKRPPQPSKKQARSASENAAPARWQPEKGDKTIPRSPGSMTQEKRPDDRLRKCAKRSRAPRPRLTRAGGP